jgi:hypothetical protein
MALFTAIAAAMAIVSAGNDAETERWARLMTPGEQHARLADRAGDWKAVVTIWNEPGGAPTTIDGVSTKTMVFGGRYLEEEFTGQFMGRPFRGRGIYGFDNATREYVAIWYDNMGTGIHLSNGQDDGKGGLTFASTQQDPVTGRPTKTRSVGRSTDRDHHVWESYTTRDGEKEFLHMRVEYTRAS